jgi:ribose transport system substrate-binding protein
MGPRGEEPTNASELTVSEETIANLRESGKTYRVGTFWQVQADTLTLMDQGLRDTWAELDVPIEISGQTIADFDAEQQVSDIQTLLGTDPDALVGILVDQAAVATAIQKANEQGVPIVFWDLPAEGQDFAAIVTSNGRLAGCRSADAMAEHLGGEGKIAVLPLTFDFYPTDQRVEGFKDRIAEYPGIEIVREDGATVYDDGLSVGEGILQAVPDLAGVFASWQDPAMGVVAAARGVGREDLVVTTVDLSDTAALEIASCGILKATAAQLPYDEGVAEAKSVANILAGEDTPNFVVTDTPLATHETLFDVYEQVFHKDPPQELVDAYEESCD